MTRVIDRGDAVAPAPAGAACLHAGLPEQARCRIAKLAPDQAEFSARIDSEGWRSLLGPTGYDRFTGEQAALRRVATLVARDAAPEEVFAAVAEEAGRLLGGRHATMSGTTRTARRRRSALEQRRRAIPVGTRARLGGRNVHTLVFQTARRRGSTTTPTPRARSARPPARWGVRATVGVPVSVEGGLWGAMAVGSTREGPLPADTEARLAGFTELVATAIANAQARVELRGFADEQAALRRVATLVARAAPRRR